MASVRSIDDALGITLNNNGRVLRNLIHGADTIMSHILHFYHLAAPDFVDISALGPPWDPAFGSTTECKLAALTTTNPLNGSTITHQLVESYVAALNMRKEAHTMGAIFSGRHPIQNAIVPGGVATLFTSTDVADFTTRLNNIRNFINSYYIPDVVFVASRTNISGQNWASYWGVGTSPGTLLSYGEYPLAAAGLQPFKNVPNSSLLISRGAITNPNSTSITVLNRAQIAEYTKYSFYSSASGLHPSVGVTTPMLGTTLANAMTNGPQYSWLKAPRYNGKAMEVGPLARMVITAFDTSAQTVTEAGSTPISTYLGSAGLTLPSAYTAGQLVLSTLTAASNVATTNANANLLGAGALWSPLGRHAARALECKYVADAMYSWLGELTTTMFSDSITHFPSSTPAGPYTTSVATGSGYTYVQIPNGTKFGEGLAEAPRGALGHWIKISGQKISNYQCVVPSTWNCGPKGTSTADRGPAESALFGLTAVTNVANANDAACNIARMLHPYDFCIACAVHVVTPDGKEIAKFKMDVDGKVKKLPLDSE